MKSRNVVIVGGSRIPFSRSFTDYFGKTNHELAVPPLKSLVDTYNLKGERIGEVVMGAVIGHSDEIAIAREAALDSGLDPHTPAYDVRQACGTSLEGVIAVANKIALGQIDVGIAGGVDTNSDIPVEFTRKFTHYLMRLNAAKGGWKRFTQALKFRLGMLKPRIPAVVERRTGKRMGDHAEMMAKDWKLKREDQDKLAVESHHKAAKAYEEGFFEDLVIPFEGLDRDTFLRPKTSVEKISTLKPAFDRENGTLTAANSSPLSDGAAAVLLASEEEAKKRGWPILAKIVDAQTAAVDFVDGEGLLIAPTYAVSEMLQRNKMKLQDFDFYEIHEAFAAQVLATLNAWESDEYCKEKLGLDKPLGSIDRSKLNVHGSSIALGHPYAATGARITATLGKLLSGTKGKKGLISICTAGGMGVTAILESPE